MAKYQLRGLKTKDIFALSRVIKAMGITVDVKAGMKGNEIGAQLIKQVIENFGDAEGELSAFIADLAGLTKEQFLDLDFEDTVEIIKEFRNLKGIQGFFTSAIEQTQSK